jgi:CubicO group peptidase (beta-lactamase class C family)
MHRFAAALALFLGLAAGAAPVHAARGTEPPAAQAALDTLLARGKATHSDTVLVLHDGTPIGHYYRDGTPPGPIELMSATKSVVALGIGQLLGDGRIKSLDQPVSDFYPEWKQGLKAGITVRMLLDHTSGIQNVPQAPKEIYPAPDAVQLALAADLTSAPGQKFSYNNKAVNLLAGIIRKASGQTMDTFFRDGLFKAMDIHPGPWDKDQTGHPYAMAGLKLTAADAAKLGQLVLDHGRWKGRQQVPADFIDTMLAPGQEQDPTCGLLWWRRPAWVRFATDPDSFGLLRKRGVPDAIVGKLESLRGAHFDSSDAAVGAVIDALGAHGADVLRKELVGRGIGPYRLFAIDRGPAVAFEANGYLGQYIVVIPAAGLVGVRQIDGRPDQPDDDGYADFTRRMTALARAMGALPPEPAPPAH